MRNAQSLRPNIKIVHRPTMFMTLAKATLISGLLITASGKGHQKLLPSQL